YNPGTVPAASSAPANAAVAAGSAASGTVPARVDAAVARLLALLPPAEPEAAAQQIAILVQSHAATAALIAAAGKLDPPPVPTPRRIGPDGALVGVDLTGRPFGAGPRACPGAELARALAAGVLSR